MRYEKSHNLQNAVLQLTLAAFILIALFVFDHSNPEMAGVLENQQLASGSIAIK
ncbi:MAG TPA: hypothetical protein PK950_01700 [Candidatus Paceibacterota bacterium]|nr:hypothetical protein [Candidatus Paceibacterota bacterium]